MKCNCYKKAFLPVIELLERASGIMYYNTPDYDLHQERIHDIVVTMNTNVALLVLQSIGIITKERYNGFHSSIQTVQSLQYQRNAICVDGHHTQLRYLNQSNRFRTFL